MRWSTAARHLDAASTSGSTLASRAKRCCTGVRFLQPESVFRSRWSYQNIMYLAAGQAAGKAGGSTWDDLVQTRIFTPLGMTSSLVTSRGMTNTNAATARSTRA